MSICRVWSVFMREISRRLLVVLGTMMASVCVSWAGVSFDVSVGLPLGDDAKVFLNVTNEYYAPQPEVAMAVVQRCPHPEDDFPTVLLLAQASGRAPGEILDLHLRGQSWNDIMFNLHVPPSVLFSGIDRDPGPPYGRAWGHWKHHPNGRFMIQDSEFAELAKLRVTAGYYHVSPSTVIGERKRGITHERFVADRHRGRMKGREDGQGSDDEGGNGHGPHSHGANHGRPPGRP